MSKGNRATVLEYRDCEPVLLDPARRKPSDSLCKTATLRPVHLAFGMSCTNICETRCPGGIARRCMQRICMQCSTIHSLPRPRHIRAHGKSGPLPDRPLSARSHHPLPTASLVGGEKNGHRDRKAIKCLISLSHITKPTI